MHLVCLISLSLWNYNCILKKVKYIFSFLFLYVANDAVAQAKNIHPLSIYNRGVLQGQGGLKITAGTRFHKQSFIELGYFRTDMPNRNDTTLEDKFLPLGNQNIFSSITFLKINNDVYWAPKIGYEYSLLLFSVKASWVIYFNATSKERDTRILLEPGISLFGMASIHYGFLYHVSGVKNDKIGKHSLTVTVNYFDAYRSKYKKL